MKKYDRSSKKWISIEEYERIHKPRNKEFCRGKKPHDFVLVLPEYVSYNEKYQHNPEAYYELIDAIDVFEEELDRRIKDLGVVERFSRGTKWKRSYRFYLCSVCKKKHYEYKE